MKLNKNTALRFLRGGRLSSTVRIRVVSVDRGRFFGFRFVMRGKP
jgi:hypothetical protein